MRRSFILNIEPFSLNAKFCRDLRYTSSGYKQWTMRFFTQMDKKTAQMAMKELREVFDLKKHAYSVRMTAYYPRFYTKEGTISATTEDITNWEKLAVDHLFLPKNHVLPVPYGCPNLNVDDKHIVQLTSRKRPAVIGEKQTYIKVEIAIVNRL